MSAAAQLITLYDILREAPGVYRARFSRAGIPQQLHCAHRPGGAKDNRRGGACPLSAGTRTRRTLL